MIGVSGIFPFADVDILQDPIIAIFSSVDFPLVACSKRPDIYKLFRQLVIQKCQESRWIKSGRILKHISEIIDTTLRLKNTTKKKNAIYAFIISHKKYKSIVQWEQAEKPSGAWISVILQLAAANSTSQFLCSANGTSLFCRFSEWHQQSLSQTELHQQETNWIGLQFKNL